MPGARTSVSVSFIYFWLQVFFQIVLVASVHHQPSSVLLNFQTLSSNSFDKSVGDKAAKCVLEGLRSLYIKDNFFVESRAFVYNCL